jgi:ATP-dependent Zn protease
MTGARRHRGPIVDGQRRATLDHAPIDRDGFVHASVAVVPAANRPDLLDLVFPAGSSILEAR